jgi:carbonic anhydrase
MRELYESLAEKQKPHTLFLTCGDSRIEPSVLTGTKPGEIFVERTPGNIVPMYDDAASVGVSASIEYAVATLEVANVIVCGHSTCGAMEALLKPNKLDRLPATSRWLKYAQPAVDQLNRKYPLTVDSARLTILTKLNVLEQMTHLRSHPAVEERLQRGTLGIFGWFYEIHTGTVEVFDPVKGIFGRWPEGD